MDEIKNLKTNEVKTKARRFKDSSTTNVQKRFTRYMGLLDTWTERKIKSTTWEPWGIDDAEILKSHLNLILS